MAKLKAHGEELARVARDNPAPSDTVQRSRHTVALFSDGWVLEKTDVVFNDGRKHSYGWTRRAKSPLTREQFIGWAATRGYVEAERLTRF